MWGVCTCVCAVCMYIYTVYIAGYFHQGKISPKWFGCTKIHVSLVNFTFDGPEAWKFQCIHASSSLGHIHSLSKLKQDVLADKPRISLRPEKGCVIYTQQACIFARLCFLLR